MRGNVFFVFVIVLGGFLLNSCLKKDLYKGEEEGGENGKDDGYEYDEDAYTYPYGQENKAVDVELTIQADERVDLSKIEVEIPCLKYNKSWLMLLSLDDCRQDAFSCTWAAINGKPLNKEYFYDIGHLKTGDLPPNAYYLNKTLGSTDGAGNEVRFSYMFTLSPEWDWMNFKTVIRKGYSKDYYRFFMKAGLVWQNVVEMLNYGAAIAFHNVRTKNEKDVDSVKLHYSKVQDIILDKLSSRGCKVLAEPDGNKTYITAAQGYDPIQIMTAQGDAASLYPFKTNNDLSKAIMLRTFTSEENMKNAIRQELRLKREDRKAVQVGMHGTNESWAKFLLWLNDTYGKDGDDSLWCTSLEEYYEYNYYRIHSSVEKKVEGNTIKVLVRLPSKQYFYYPSITVNLKGLDKQYVTSVISGDVVTGMSMGSYEGGTMINVDCRKFLVEHAVHYVEQYEANRTESNRADALYFVNMLKESAKKKELSGRLSK